MILHHRVNNLLPLLLQTLPLLVSLLHLPLLVQGTQQQIPLFVLLDLCHPWVGILVGPLYCQHFVAVQSLVGHCLFCEFGHASMSKFDEGVAFVRENVYVFDISPNCKVPQQHLIHLCNSVFIADQLEIADVDSFGLFGEAAHPLHVFPVRAESRSAEDIFRLVNRLTILKRWNFMVILAVDAIRATSSREEKTVEGSSFLIEEVCSSIADIELRVAFSKGGFLVLLVFRADVLAVPEVVFLIALLVGVIIGERCLDLLAGWPLEGVRKGEILLLFAFDELLGNVLVDVAAGFGGGAERGEIGLHAVVQLLRQLPNRLARLRVEVVVLFLLLVEENLERLDQLINLFAIHLF